MIFNNFCELNNCDKYHVWEYSDGEGQSYVCFSCELIGQSHNVEMIPDDCPYYNKDGKDYKNLHALAEARFRAGEELQRTCFFCQKKTTGIICWKDCHLYNKLIEIIAAYDKAKEEGK